jgi:hypothetical protein
MCAGLAGGVYEDDTTLVLIRCRKAEEITLMSGPPSKQQLDHAYVSDFMDMPGKKAVCGSTTTDIVARELNAEVKVTMSKTPGQLPEYAIEGVDIVAEGAITLNQVYNILDEPFELLSEDTVAERLCLALREADVVHLMMGSAQNAAHKDLIFKQTGVNVRGLVLQQITDKLKDKGKLIIKQVY